MNAYGNAHSQKRPRQRAILELIAGSPIRSQEELVERLRERGFDVTQATVSRDIAELGLVKAQRGEAHAYTAPENVAAGNAADRRLRRLLEDIPVRIGRSGLSLVLVAAPGLANAIAQAIDQSSLSEQVGTVAGDNTLLVLFEDEASLERWRGRFEAFQPRSDAGPRGDGIAAALRPPGRGRAGSPDPSAAPAGGGAAVSAGQTPPQTPHPSDESARAAVRALANSEAPR